MSSYRQQYNVLIKPERAFSRILNVQKSIFILLFFVHCRHERSIRRDAVGAKEEECLFGMQFDAFTNHIMELTHCQVGGYQVFLRDKNKEGAGRVLEVLKY